MSAEYAIARDDLAGKKGDELYSGWLRFLMRLTIAKKNQDCGWGWHVVRHTSMPVEHPEHVAVRDLFALAESAGGPDKLEYERLFGDATFTDYEQLALREAQIRASCWGMESDRWMGLMAMAVISRRGLPENEIQAMLEEQKENFKGTSVRTLPELPYYCYDMHTRPGKMALRVWKKHYASEYNLPEDAVSALVFHYMSALVGEKVGLPILPADTHILTPTWAQQLWFMKSKSDCAKWCGFSTPASLEAFYRKNIDAKVTELIQWAVKKSMEG
jgi:hypothetical protein